MKKAFTLVELLVVVLIIGILTAVALPMYQGAVDKSHWSTMLPAAKAIKDAEEAIKMTNGEYTDTMEHLDVTMNDADLNFTLTTLNNMSDPNVIRVTNPKLANVRLASYLDQSPMFAGQLHCEALKTDERAKRLCGKLLNGEELTEKEGYVSYLLNQSITKEICGNADLVWSNKQTKCFQTAEDRCKANGMYNNGFCGYSNGAEGTDKDHRLILEEGASCQPNLGGGGYCQNLEIHDGGKCTANQYEGGCNNNYFLSGSECIASATSGCSQSTYEDGSRCVGSGFSYTYGACSRSTFESGSECEANAERACGRSTFKSGAKCIANIEGACSVTGDWWHNVIYDGGCCEGEFCPSNAPKC